MLSWHLNSQSCSACCRRRATCILTSREFKFSFEVTSDAELTQVPILTGHNWICQGKKKHSMSWQWDDTKDGGRCPRLEINIVEHDRVKRWALAQSIIDCCGIGLLRWSRHGVTEHLRLYLVFGTLHLTLWHCEFVRGNQAEELLAFISSCQLGYVSRDAL